MVSGYIVLLSPVTGNMEHHRQVTIDAPLHSAVSKLFGATDKVRGHIHNGSSP